MKPGLKLVARDILSLNFHAKVPNEDPRKNSKVEAQISTPD